MSELFLVFLLVGSVLLCGYVYFGYPFCMWLLSRFRCREVVKREITPRVSLIIAAYNEEACIAAKLENALALDYPPQELEIIVASDGSTDGTEERVRAYADKGVRLLSLPRGGKNRALDRAVAASSGEILLFSDANVLFHPLALRKLVRNLADPEVGGVAGNKLFVPDGSRDSTPEGEKLYWSYDKWLKGLESRCGSVVAADGAIYAVRRELYFPVAEWEVTDDFAISTHVVEKGFRLVYEEEALAFEEGIASAQREFSRKVRLMSRGLRGLLLRRRLLNPLRYGRYSLVLLSHKVLRRLVPLFLLLALACSLLLAYRHAVFQWAALVQLSFYGAAAAGFALHRTRLGQARILMIPFYFCLGNLAALVALIRLATGRRVQLWEPQRQGANS